jgi:predicted Zn-dependent protease
MKQVRVFTVTILLMLAPLVLAQRTKLRPGFNMFSADQDVEIGREVARDAERQLRILNNRDVAGYLSTLGRRLSSNAPGERYPYQFKVVDDKAINAFALPGGFLYINRGIFEAADNEAQLAGVVSHEIAHVALRHGTNQMSKAYAAQAPLAILGGVIGNDSIGGILAQLGASFAANSVLLKFSRDAERQADLMGAQMLYDSNYDPRAMTHFFQKLEASGGSRGVQFFSSHPNPGDRAGNITGEIQKLGGTRSFRNDSLEFQRIKRIIRSK